jgi:single-strand DNA-binding protein
METYITVQGNITADPVPRATANGATVVNIRVASNTRRFDREANEWRDGDTTYIGVTCWRTLAVNVCSTLRKGDTVVVFGKLLQRSYETKDGEQRTVHEIDAISVGPDLNRWAADLRRPNRAAAPAAEETAVAEAAEQPEVAEAAA